jgi:hypothetical protein
VRCADPLGWPKRHLVAGWLAGTAVTVFINAAWAQQPASADEPMFIVNTEAGSTLIGLSKRYLADPRRWPELASVNALRNPHRLAIGEPIRIPLRLMRVQPVAATVVSVTGSASTASSPVLKAGEEVPEGGEVVTGADGHVTIRLVDGTLLRLRPDSRLQVRESNRLPDAGAVRSGARLKNGRIEVDAAPAPAGRPGFTIDTPQGVLGVRGTEFRVAVGEAAGVAVTRGEVLGGAVVFSGAPGGAGGRAGAPVAAGFGTRIDPQGSVAPPVPLLPKPDVQNLPALQERLVMRFDLPTLPGAVAYRGVIASDPGFDKVVAEVSANANANASANANANASGGAGSKGTELRFAALPDGDYTLRVRGIDAQGLEGLDADHRFRLKARPEAPLPSAPAPRAKLNGNSADLAWTANPEAQSYRLRLSSSADFKTLLRDLSGLRGAVAQLQDLPAGVYYWQLASVRGDNDQGPWGDVNSFEVRQPPPAAAAPQVNSKAITLSWAALPGQTFDVEVARDAGFTQLVQRLSTTQSVVELALPFPAPSSGRFFVRLRAKDADGYVGPFGSAQFFDIQGEEGCRRLSHSACARAGQETQKREQ